MRRFARAKLTTEKLIQRRLQIFGVLLLYMVGIVTVKYLIDLHRNISGNNGLQQKTNNDGIIRRKLLAATTLSPISGSINKLNSSLVNTTAIPCTRPSIEEFPKDLFTQKQRRYGAVLLHVLLALYMFIALAFVCDDYFISSLDKICEHLNLSEDVAGATFMAAGSSAPELFTAVIGVFIAKGDVGVGTIVGSAVFNILVIIAICALFAGQVIHLTPWPLCRDAFYYIIAISALIITLYDGTVVWYESMIMVLLYFGYIVLMKFNPRIVAFIDRQKQRHKIISKRVGQSNSDTNLIGSKDQFAVRYVNPKTTPDGKDCECTEMNENKKRMTWRELGLMIMLTNKFSPSTRFRAACLIVIHREDHKRMMKRLESGNVEEDKQEIIPAEHGMAQEGESVPNGEAEEPVTPFLYPAGSPVRAIFWAMSLPIVILMYFTIPDCRKARWERWWLATFLLSIFWIMVFSYVMVWMVCVVGFTIGVPDVIMGITFLAAGTSIPDAIASLLVAREGMGDMAVSNSIGSNIFDILIGLAVPWFLKTAVVHPGVTVRINSRGMVYSVALLFASVVITVFIIHCNKWRLDKKLGIIFTLIYSAFITMSACIEFNLFAFVNSPTCPYEG